MKKIFNGKDFSGWVVPEDSHNWTAANGMITVRSDAKKEGSTLWTTQSYQDFIFQTDFKMGEGVVDSGIFLREEALQIQIGISGSLKKDMTASPYIPGKGYPVEAKQASNLLKADEWNTIKVQAIGKESIVWLNGQEVLRYTADDAVKRGPIGLQLHPGNEMHIDFKNLLLAEL